MKDNPGNFKPAHPVQRGSVHSPAGQIGKSAGAMQNKVVLAATSSNNGGNKGSRKTKSY